jgi:hypothetical protein
VAGELGPREEAVLERLVRGIADGAPAAEPNASCACRPDGQPGGPAAIEPVTAA